MIDLTAEDTEIFAEVAEGKSLRASAKTSASSAVKESLVNSWPQDSLTFPAFAKINLRLWVLGKRAYRLTDAAEPVASIFLKGVTTDGV